MRLIFNFTEAQAEQMLIDTLPNYFPFRDTEEEQLYIDYFKKELLDKINDGSIEDVDAFIRKKQETLKSINEIRDYKDYNAALKLYQTVGVNECNRFKVVYPSPKLNYFLVEYF